ncbi:hypothetical protein PanWU01x14_325860 [Parasponia andersonii]|uniref:Uncharacterized protein n=1 Tax=Parasponia andersonii TaxID=3476 RepID=A0A2P5AJV8_PARAD|nr:hypothetical protein PanWU01x14_325860 [Parasponia andersonii]
MVRTINLGLIDGIQMKLHEAGTYVKYLKVLWISKGHDEGSDLGCRENSMGESSYEIFVRSVQFNVELSSGEFKLEDSTIEHLEHKIFENYNLWCKFLRCESNYSFINKLASDKSYLELSRYSNSCKYPLDISEPPFSHDRIKSPSKRMWIELDYIIENASMSGFRGMLSPDAR